MTIPNFDAENRVHYGYISSNSLDPETVHELMYGPHATSISYQEAYDARQAEIEQELEILAEEQDEVTRQDWIAEETSRRMEIEEIHCEEEIVEGTYQEVKYLSSWLGGALHFFILKSPHISNRELCSPCVPNAGNLNQPVLEGDNNPTYDVPADWRAQPIE